MKKYIFLTRPLANAGGVQCYVSAKALCLEKKGWNVNVIYYDFKRRNYSLYSSLEKFVKCNVVGLGICPYMFPKVVVERLLQKIVTCVGNVVDYDEIIIESHDAPTSQWGELLANKIKARHFFYTMEESYRGKNVFYEPQIDFYLFKFDRKEILGTSTAFNRLFDEYRIITKKDYPGDLLIAEAPIQDIPCSRVEEIKRRYWNICYIGRGDKPYVPNVIKEIGNFACQHKDKSIQFITVGDMKEHESLINEITRKNKNLTILELGIMLPIPKHLYDKVDVVIAGAGSARHSTEEGAITIVANPETKQSNGILGYETLSSVFQSEDSVCSSFVDALDRVLVRKVHQNMEFRYPQKLDVDECTRQNFNLFSFAKKELIYYDSNRLLQGKRDWLYLSKILLSCSFPKTTTFFSNILKTRKKYD